MITLIANLKGGSGKSTVTFNLAVWLAYADQAVFVYDLDPQCTLTDVQQVRQDEGYEPSFKIYNRYQKPQQKTDKSQAILIDVGAANMNAMKKAISVANRIIIPVGPSQADIWSTQRFLYIIASAVGDPPPPVHAFVNRADTHAAVKESDETEAALVNLPGVNVLTNRLCQRTVYRRSFSEGLAVFELESNGKAAQEFHAFAQALYPDLTLDI